MRISSLTDIIMMKLMRIKQIEDNKGKTFVSEGVDANYHDIIIRRKKQRLLLFLIYRKI